MEKPAKHLLASVLFLKGRWASFSWTQIPQRPGAHPSAAWPRRPEQCWSSAPTHHVIFKPFSRFVGLGMGAATQIAFHPAQPPPPGHAPRCQSPHSGAPWAAFQQQVEGGAAEGGQCARQALPEAPRGAHGARPQPGGQGTSQSTAAPSAARGRPLLPPAALLPAQRQSWSRAPMLGVSGSSLLLTWGPSILPLAHGSCATGPSDNSFLTYNWQVCPNIPPRSTRHFCRTRS